MESQKQKEGAWRLKGGVPKIGIRPCIDGRRNGVRESLEDQTMGMAQAAARLIQENVHLTNGQPVEVVIADTTIGGVAEAMACAEKFEKEGVHITLTVTPCWCYGTETLDMDPKTIKAVWGFNGTERPGAVYLACAMAGYAQKGLPCFSIYGHDVQDQNEKEIPADVAEKILRFARAAVAADSMRGKSYLSVGAVCMGIAGSIVDQDFFQQYLGMRCEGIDEVEILRRIDRGIYDHEEYEKALAWVKEHCEEGFDKNPGDLRFTREQKDQQWEFVVKCAIIFRDLMVGNPKLAEMGFIEESCGRNAIAAGFQGQRQWTDHLPNGDFLEAILNSQFDWNGIREAYVVATENDSLNGVAMLFEHLLTGGSAGFADVRTYWSPEAVERISGKKLTGIAENGFIHLINSGAVALDASGYASDAEGKPVMKQWWNLSDADVDSLLAETEWCPADIFYFRGGGFSSHFKHGSKGGMPVTMARMNIVQGLGPVLQIAEGYTCELEEDVFRLIDKRTDPTWPTTFFVPRLTGKGAFKDVYSVMANWGANHGAFCYGHIGADLITLASILRIPVNMHNVDEDKIYRPQAWSAFGTMESEGADYRACQNFGPMYR